MITTAMVVHYIDDMEKALSFYKSGLGLSADTESPGWSTLKVNDGLDLALHTGGGTDSSVPHPHTAFQTTLVLTVDDLEAYLPRIVEYGGRLDQIIEPREGIPVRMALVWDPAGNGFQVNQYVS
jgi:predicted enzyme related to lactoylglutathione lyase